jgi:hypothetical protein
MGLMPFLMFLLIDFFVDRPRLRIMLRQSLYKESIMALLRRCLDEVRLHRGDAPVVDHPPYRAPGIDDAGQLRAGRLLDGETSLQMVSAAANSQPVSAA